MFDARDPRSTLAIARQTGPGGVAAAADYVEFRTLPADRDHSWYARGQNFVVAYTEAEFGDALARSAQPDEYALLLPDADTLVEITTPDEQVVLGGQSVVF